MTKKSNISDEDKKKLYLALESKCNAPNITFDDLYKGISEIRPISWIQRPWVFWVAIVHLLISLYMVVISSSETHNYVFGLLLFTIGLALGCVRMHYLFGKNGVWTTISVCAVLLYIAITRDFEFDKILDLYTRIGNIIK